MSPDLAELRALWEAGTPQPWRIECEYEYVSEEERAEDHPECDCRVIVGGTQYSAGDSMRIYDEGGHDHDDAALIVAMHAALPSLLKIAETAQAYVAKVTAHDLDNEGIHSTWLELLAALGFPASIQAPQK